MLSCGVMLGALLSALKRQSCPHTDEAPAISSPVLLRCKKLSPIYRLYRESTQQDAGLQITSHQRGLNLRLAVDLASPGSIQQHGPCVFESPAAPAVKASTPQRETPHVQYVAAARQRSDVQSIQPSYVGGEDTPHL